MTVTIASGSFTSTGAAFNLSIVSGFDEFELVNITDVGSAAAATPVMRAYCSSLMPAGSAYLNLKTNGAATLALESMIVANGFTVFDNGAPPVFPLVALTGITAASPAVVTANGHGLVVGDFVRLSQVNNTMQTMSGQVYSVITVADANHFTISFDASAAAAGQVGNVPATAGFCQKVIPNPFEPQNIEIGPTTLALIAGGAAGTVQLCLNKVPAFLSPTCYQVGAKMRITIPVPNQIAGATWGPTALDSQVGTITAVTAQAGYNNAANLITLSGFTPAFVAALPALVYPAGALGSRFRYPFISDIAEVATILTEAEDNKGIRGITIGTGVQTVAKLYQWFARKGFSV